MAKHKTISIAGQIFEQLEQDILIGKYKRGEILTELKLSEARGVSRTPIREALRRLEQEHLIEETSRGAVVVGITEKDLEDIYEIRNSLEGIVAERAAANATEEQLEAMREVIELQQYYSQKDSDNADKIKDLDSQFHEMLYRLSASEIFVQTLLPLHKKLIKFRKASIRRHGRALQSAAEHQSIYEAIRSRDGQKAKELTLFHINKAKNNILNKEID